MKTLYLLIAVMLGSLSLRAASVVPYLETPTPDGMTVHWISDSDSSAVVYYGTENDKLDSSITGSVEYISGGGVSYYYYTARLTGLSASTYYYYRVDSGTDSSEVARFRTQPPTGTNTGIYRVLVVGDHQMRNDARHYELVTRARSKIEAMYGVPIEEAIDLCLNTGDQVDTGTPDHYRYIHFYESEPISANLPIMTAVGNHETYGTPGIALYDTVHDFADISYNGISSGNERSMAYQLANILFVHTNSEEPNAAQTSWLGQVAGTAITDASVDWIVSIVHRPYQAEQYVGDISTWFRETGMPILNTTGKHALNIGAHHHIYARGQVRDNATYHIISGGTAWDQYWGQSTEEDMDDVTKTIANWAWQIIEFDLDQRTMTVNCYSEGHPLLRFAYESVLIDSFTRKLGLAAPQQPELEAFVNTADDTLPLLLKSGAYASSSTETFYSTQFQVSKSSDFSAAALEIDHIRDIEDYYGDTGSPDYTPVDVNKKVNILEYTVGDNVLNNGTYYARVRHRDTNAEWSPWSEAVSFTVVGSTDAAPELVLDKSVYSTGDTVTVTYTNGLGNAKDWVGIYKKGETPADTTSQAFAYVNAENLKNGSVSFSNLSAGNEYFAGFFENNGYTEIAPRQSFYLGATPTIVATKTAYESGETVTIDYTGAPGGAKDWIGIYKMGQVPGSTGSTQWSYTPDESGSVSFAALADGFYFAVFMINDGYAEVSERIYVQVGDAPATVTTLATRFEVGDTFPIYFSGGAGTAKDYIGVFNKDAVNLGEQGEELVSYQYVDGQSSGSITFSQALPKGQYFLSLFMNDSYTEISNRVYFGVGEDYVPAAKIQLTKGMFALGEDIVVSYSDGPGNAKDWVGVYHANDVVPSSAIAASYVYVDSSNPSSGTVTISADLPAGDYYVALFEDDAYAELTSRLAFSIAAAADLGSGNIGGEGFEEFPGFYYSTWLGWYYHENASPWYYIYDMGGWVYLTASSSNSDFIFWSYKSSIANWCWTSSDMYPTVWAWNSEGSGSWLNIRQSQP
ncbi:MAG: fibronectin type III domain-containing protein [Opitutales bacterium]|nr:fibronectin type III domain-containing protein [Opitutales bacterium]